MAVHAAGGPSDRFDLEVGDRVTDNVKSVLKLCEGNLLEENVQFSLNLFCFVEEGKFLLFSPFR